MKVVIIGGGIIGSSCSYYLAKRGVAVTLIETEGIACAASGKAGGFLARTWSEGRDLDALSKLSYNLHQDLGKVFNDVGYRSVNTYSGVVDERLGVEKKSSTIISWVDGPVVNQKLLDTNVNTSQVHPKLLSERFIYEAKIITNGETMVVFDKAIGIEYDNSESLPSIKGVKLESGSMIEADTIVITLGPWSYKAVNWFPKGCLPEIKGERAHSVVLKVPDDVEISADCLFLQYRTSEEIISPEIYPRPDGSVYVCGLSDDKDVPDKASDVDVDSWRCTKLREMAIATCGKLKNAEVIAEQACYLPMTPDGFPVIGKIRHVKGAYIASGHSCWGILNSTGTGYAIAELIVTGECKTLDLKAFDPNRFI